MSKTTEPKQEDYTVMLAILTFIILNAAFIAFRNDDPLALWFTILGLILVGILGYYIVAKRRAQTDHIEQNVVN